MSTIQIAGQEFTLYRTHADQAASEVYIQRGDQVELRRPDISVYAQYDIVEVAHAADCRRQATCGGTTIGDTCTCGRLAEIAPIREELLREARLFLSSNRQSLERDVIHQRERTSAADAATTWRGPESMDHEDSIF